MPSARPPHSALSDFGESYLQEALPKIEQLRELALTWHFIGRVQANKTRAIAEHFDWVHGIDRLQIAERLSAQRPHHAPPLQRLPAGQYRRRSAKGGVDPDEAAALAAAVACAAPAAPARPDVHPAGGSRPRRPTAAASRALQRSAQRLNARGLALDTLSMGMSADFREAILRGRDPGAHRHGAYLGRGP